MGNKQKLQTNNTELGSILSTVKGLPVIDDVKNGAYVWKKYTPEKTYSFNVTMITAVRLKLKYHLMILTYRKLMMHFG